MKADLFLLGIGAALAATTLAAIASKRKTKGTAGIGDLPPFYPWESGPVPSYETTDRAYRQAQILQSQEVNAAGKVILSPGDIQPVQYYKCLPRFPDTIQKSATKSVAVKANEAVKKAADVVKGKSGISGLADAAYSCSPIPCNPFLFEGLGTTMPKQTYPAEFEAINATYEVVD